MASLSAASLASSPHRDVLEAEPDTLEAKDKLLEEIKSRAKGCVLSKNWPQAHLLYERALTLVPDDATVSCNLSLCNYNMGQWEEARKAAQTAVDNDKKYVKAYWRLSQSLTKLHRNEESLKALKQALVYDPTNKAVQKEKVKVDKLWKEEQQALKDAMEVDEEEKDNQKPASAPAPAPPKTTPAAPKTTSTSETSKTTEKSADGEFTKSDHVRGYKIVNGKKTSYFHNELTEETKKLIGDIAPKRIETPVAPAAAPSKSTSAWNKAGTWEERDVSEWASTTLEELLLAVKFQFPASSPAPNAVASVSKVKLLDGGHASVATVRGKKRYIYEYAIKLDWQVTGLADAEDELTKGEMAFPDFDGTCEVGEGYDMVEYSVTQRGAGGLTPLLDRFVKNGGLRDALHEGMDQFVHQFKETY